MQRLWAVGVMKKQLEHFSAVTPCPQGAVKDFHLAAFSIASLRAREQEESFIEQDHIKWLMPSSAC